MCVVTVCLMEVTQLFNTGWDIREISLWEGVDLIPSPQPLYTHTHTDVCTLYLLGGFPFQPRRNAVNDFQMQIASHLSHKNHAGKMLIYSKAAFLCLYAFLLLTIGLRLYLFTSAFYLENSICRHIQLLHISKAKKGIQPIKGIATPRLHPNQIRHCRDCSRVLQQWRILITWPIVTSCFEL